MSRPRNAVIIVTVPTDWHPTHLHAVPETILAARFYSRRLSLKDIEASYRLRYNHRALLGSFSYVGSQLDF